MNYPVTTPFGQVAGYPLNNGFHNGIDYGFPMGTPVVVNGVIVGLSNNTGASSGPHLHVGRWVNGAATDPGVGNGFQFNSAVVTEIHPDNTDGNGKWVRVQGDGASWVYLHLQSVLVTKGQELKGENMAVPTIDVGGVNTLYYAFLGRPPEAQDASNIGRAWQDVVYDLAVSEEHKNYLSRIQKALGDEANLSGAQIEIDKIKAILNG